MSAFPSDQENTPVAPFDLQDVLQTTFLPEEESTTGAFASHAFPPSRGTEQWTEPPKPAASSKPSGWLMGIALGVLIGLWLLPPVRYTLGSQLRFALAQDGLPWVLSLDTQRTLREAPRLDAVAALLPDDYLLQVGRATAFVELGGVRPTPSQGVDHADEVEDNSDHTLLRLTRVAHDFPIAAGAQAHLARYMMVDRVRIQRAELARKIEGETRKQGDKEKADGEVSKNPAQRRSPEHLNIERLNRQHPTPTTIPARYTDVKLMRLALSNGERLDPDNVFWPAMLAATYFAAGRDTQALAALERCDRKTRWDAYIYEEVLGQWRLYSLAYGDHGATQKIGPLSLIAFPHLRELRYMAEMARWHADQEATKGNVRAAIQIRHHILHLGSLLRTTATWAYEALYGTDLVLIAASDANMIARQSSVRTIKDWQMQAQKYLTFLQIHNKLSEVTLLTAEVEECCKLRAQVDVARADSSYPGIPPGIPLMGLFGSWMTGVCLIQQLLALFCCAVVGWCVQQLMMRQKRWSRRSLFFGWLGLTGTVIVTSSLLQTPFLSSRMAIVFLAAMVCLLTVSIASVQRAWWRLRQRRNSWYIPRIQVSSVDTDCEKVSAWQIHSWEQRWSHGTTWRILLFLFVPSITTLWLLRPLLCSLHPVAQLLTNIMGVEPDVSASRVFIVALLACGFPLLLITSLCFWALWRNVPVLAAVTFGLRRLLLPAVGCIALLYLLLLQQTLSLDTEATHAINEVARDDLHWVLTHSEK